MKLRPYQVQAVQAVTQAFQDNASALIVMPTGCHAEGSLVLGFDGLPKRVEAVQIGDALMGPDGAPRIVLHLARGVAPLVRIRPIKGAPFVVTSDHVLALVRTEDDAGKRKRGGEVVDVPVCEWLRWSKTQKHLHKLFRASVDFDQEHQDFWWNRFRLPAYFVGAMLGDGSFRRQMSFTCADEKVIEEIVLTLSMLDIDAHELTKHHCGNARQFIFQSLHRHAQEQKNLRKYFALMGLNMANAESKRIPYAYRIAPRADRIEILAGLMDTDGHATCGGYDYVSKSRLLAEDVAFVARSLGLAAYVAACEKFCQTGGGGTYYRVSISGNCSMVPCRVPRKRIPERRQKKDVLRTGFSVEPLEAGKYFGFTVSGDNRYLLDDFTVTHNCGKTQVFCALADEYRKRGRVMILAHREELIWQAAKRVEQTTGKAPEIEMAELEAGGFFNYSPIVVSSVQTQLAGENGNGRMTRFKPEDFGLLILDEAHHAPAASWRKVIAHYRTNANLKVLGVTATPDRHDEAALGQVFETVAFDYELPDAIHDGWLVPITQRAVHLSGLDYSTVRTTAGDLNGADLAEVLQYEEPLLQMAQATMEQHLALDEHTLDPICALQGDEFRQRMDGIAGAAQVRKTLVFNASVEHAKRYSEILNRWAPGCARWVCGMTPKEERRLLFRDYRDLKFGILCNVDVATEGFDEPAVEVVVMARPTKSRARYSQMCGRGTRPLPGLIDGIEDSEERRLAISMSEKPSVEIVDFVGNVGRHKLVTAADILGGKYPDAVVARAKKNAEAEGKDGRAVDAANELERAERELDEEKEKARRAALRARAIYSSSFVDPFDVLAIHPQRERGWDKGKPISDKMRALLERNGIATANLSFAQARQLTQELFRRWDGKLCSFKQAKLLRRRGVDTSNLTRAEATKQIDEIAARENWKKRESAGAEATR